MYNQLFFHDNITERNVKIHTAREAPNDAKCHMLPSEKRRTRWKKMYIFAYWYVSSFK